MATSERGDRVAPVLVFACGNPSRGDDALGPSFVDRIAVRLEDEVRSGTLELLTDFQLQVEHALDLVGRAQVVFVDASVSCAAPFAWTAAAPVRDGTFSTHAMSPAAVLATYREITGDDPPPSHILGIRGYEFELGEALSSGAAVHLDAAIAFFIEWLAGRNDSRGGSAV